MFPSLMVVLSPTPLLEVTVCGLLPADTSLRMSVLPLSHWSPGSRDTESHTAQALNVFKLIDETDDEGAIWDTKGQIVAIQYWKNPEVTSRKKKIYPTGSPLAWLNYAGRWGNRGESDCSWKRFDLPCQVSSASADRVD